MWLFFFFFCLDCVKLVTFSILQSYPRNDVDALSVLTKHATCILDKITINVLTKHATCTKFSLIETTTYLFLSFYQFL